MGAKQWIGYINVEDGKLLVLVKQMRWGRALSLRLSGKNGEPLVSESHYLTCHPFQVRRLQQGYSISIRNEEMNL